jgi:hypothetical protein
MIKENVIINGRINSIKLLTLIYVPIISFILSNFDNGTFASLCCKVVNKLNKLHNNQ